MAKEKAESIVESIRKALKEGGKKNGGGAGGIPDEMLFIPKDGVKTVRFLSDFDEAVEVLQHDKFGEMFPQPCLKYYGKKCPFDDAAGYRASTFYVYTVFDYETESKRILVIKPTLNSAMEDLLEIYDKNGTLKDRDIKLMRVVLQGKSKYKAREVQSKPTEFEGKLKNPYPMEKVFGILKQTIAVVKPKATELDEADEEAAGEED